VTAKIQQTHGHGADKPGGFTLIELLVVIAIIAIFSRHVASSLEQGQGQSGRYQLPEQS
jgi:prepilin-type N-terminal cleavage/methylation domain-containing protein